MNTKNARADFLKSLVTNIKSTGLTAYYGSLGLSVSHTIPLLGKQNPFAAIFFGLLPIISRIDQVGEVLDDQKSKDAKSDDEKSKAEKSEAEKGRYYKKIFTRVGINMIMPAITYITAANYGFGFAAPLLTSWLLSKVIAAGDYSPLDHTEHFFSGSTAEIDAPGRNNFFESLQSNLKDTVMAGWYGVVGLAMTTGAPILGTVSPIVGVLLMLTPIISRIDQVRQIENDHPNIKDGNYTARAMVRVLLNACIGFTVAGAANYFSAAGAASGVLLGYVGGKVSSEGDNSPLKHFENWVTAGDHVKRLEEQRAAGTAEHEHVH